MKTILIKIIFGESKPIDSCSTGVTTVTPDEQLSFNQWCIALNVSRYYGKY